MMKDAPKASLISAIRAVAAGKSAISPEVRRMIARDPPVDVLTPRQVEVLQSLTRGLTNRDIANQLSISEDRVEQHIRSLLEKLGAANRTDAEASALRKHLHKIVTRSRARITSAAAARALRPLPPPGKAQRRSIRHGVREFGIICASP